MRRAVQCRGLKYASMMDLHPEDGGSVFVRGSTTITSFLIPIVVTDRQRHVTPGRLNQTRFSISRLCFLSEQFSTMRIVLTTNVIEMGFVLALVIHEMLRFAGVWPPFCSVCNAVICIAVSVSSTAIVCSFNRPLRVS